MGNIRKPDVKATLRARFKRSSNKKLQQLSLNDISDLLDEMGDSLSDILAAAPLSGFDGVNLGAGQIKMFIRKPQNIHNVNTGEKVTTLPTALYYFKPSHNHKSRMKEVMKEFVKKVEEGEIDYNG